MAFTRSRDLILEEEGSSKVLLGRYCLFASEAEQEVSQFSHIEGLSAQIACLKAEIHDPYKLTVLSEQQM